MISIIVPFYNTEKYFEKCLSSLKDQIYSNFEVLMIDDGSTDKSQEIALDFARKDNRFKYLGGKHIGFALSKNLGLDNAKGDYICFVDSDDYVEPQYLELLYNALISNNADMVCCGYSVFVKVEPNYKVIEDKQIVCTDMGSKISYLFSTQGSSFQWNKLYKKELFYDIRFQDVMALSDTMECYKLYEKANKVVILSNKIINHRIHKSSISSTFKNSEGPYWKHRLKIYIDMCNYLYEKCPKSLRLLREILSREIKFTKEHLSADEYQNLLKNANQDLILWTY